MKRRWIILTTQKRTNIGFGNTQKRPFFVLCVCLFPLVVVFVVIRVHSFSTFAYRHPFTGLRANISCFLCCYIRGTQRRFPSKNIESSFQAIQSTFRPLALHSKRRYKTCISSVIWGKFESFRNCKGFGIVFSKSFRCVPFFFRLNTATFIRFSAFPMRRLFKGGVYFEITFLNHWNQLLWSFVKIIILCYLNVAMLHLICCDRIVNIWMV